MNDTSNDKNEEQSLPLPDRRRFFAMSAGAAAAALVACNSLGSAGSGAQAAAGTTTAAGSPQPNARPGRRRLGDLEVSEIGMGVQNTSRKYEMTVPYRPQMINLIRAAFDRGVTFFDAAEAYGPWEVERILGEAIKPFRDSVLITWKYGWSIDEQNEYSMLWRGPEQEVIATCEELGIGFVPWSPLGVQFLNGWIDANTRFAPGDIRGAESRFAPENLPHNLKLVDLVKQWGMRKRATPGQIALAWLMAQKPWIVPIPGTTVMDHMVENTGAVAVRFTPAELTELNTAVRAIEVRGARLPEQVLVFSGVEATPPSSRRAA